MIKRLFLKGFFTTETTKIIEKNIKKTSVDSAWEQKKLEARKLLINAAREAPQRPVHAVLARVIWKRAC
jgi:hypothetical protein